jgi:hypothetical protein
MIGPNRRRVWTFVSVLMLALVASVTLPSHAWGSRRYRGGHMYQHHHRFHHSSRTDFRHRHYHHHPRHHYDDSSFFWGLGFYGYPYSYPYPYAYPYYGHYTPGEHRRFPAFRLPGFFHYPGAIGKGEAEGSVKP